MKPTLIFCAAGNRRYSEIAQAAGFEMGARLPGTVYITPLYFADQNWKNPVRNQYMDALRIYRPFMASVIDWERDEQLGEVLAWAEDAAAFCETVMIIPKVAGVSRLPRFVNGKSIRLGYSVPTAHGGTDLHVAEFMGWPVHLLGGSPAAQMRLTAYLNTVSADGNMAMKMANRGLFWQPGPRTTNRWVSLKEADGVRFAGDGNYEAFARSCKNIVTAWGV
jgi:hypothetical protein